MMNMSSLNDISQSYLFDDNNNLHEYTTNTFIDKIKILKLGENDLNIKLNYKKIIQNIIISFCS